MPRLLLLLLVFLGPAWTQSSPPDPRVPARSLKPDASDRLYGGASILRLTLEISETELERLRKEPRKFAVARLVEQGGRVYEDVGVKLKGAAGSFREIDDQPAFTIDVAKYSPQQRFHDQSRFHLNNSVQDNSRLHELVASDLMSQAKIPAPRVTHARLKMNTRDLGVYVLKESFDATFLARHFVRTAGTLYDGGFLQDIDAELEKDIGRNPKERPELKALLEACRTEDPATRWRLLERQVAIDPFLSFVAMELMVAHWDGYSLNRNNYRLWFEPSQQQAWFLPHGMDQIFQDAEAPILDYPMAIVADAILRRPEWRARFRKRLQELLPLFDFKRKLEPKLQTWKKRLEPVMKDLGDERFAEWNNAVRDLENRLEARDQSLRDQVARPEPEALEFGARTRVVLKGWFSNCERGEPTIDQRVRQKPPVFFLRCQGKEGTIASFRHRIMLKKGLYTFEAKATVKGFEPIPEDKESGVSSRISGSSSAPEITTNVEGHLLRHEFEIREDRRLVELVLEVRGQAGELTVDAQSLALVKR